MQRESVQRKCVQSESMQSEQQCGERVSTTMPCSREARAKNQVCGELWRGVERVQRSV
jgi:hypothetical protein